jgi:hypothetical protein
MFTQPSLQSQQGRPPSRSLRHRIASGAIAASVLAATGLVGAIIAAPAEAAPTTGPAGTSEFRGVNWADPRDNYAADEVVPSGLSTKDDYASRPQGAAPYGRSSRAPSW